MDATRTCVQERHFVMAVAGGYLLREVAAVRPPAPVPEGVVHAAVLHAPETGVEERAVLVVRRHTGVVVLHPSPVRIVAFTAGAVVLRATPAADRRQPRLEEQPWRRRPARWKEGDEAEREEEEENEDEYVSCVHGLIQR